MNATASLWLSIALGAGAQVFLRRGVAQRNMTISARSYLTLLGSGWIWAWGVSFVFATALWMLAISTMQVSYAFPMLSMGYVVVAVLSRIFLKERIPPSRWLAIAVITLGVALIFKAS
jgi:drug/metabolite transporter (DMT)-like permease